MPKIEVRDAKDGIIVMNGLIGNCMEMFEIRLVDGKIHYWVRDIEVPVEIYRDALHLAALDRFDPRDRGGPFETDTSDPD